MSTPRLTFCSVGSPHGAQLLGRAALERVSPRLHGVAETWGRSQPHSISIVDVSEAARPGAEIDDGRDVAMVSRGTGAVAGLVVQFEGECEAAVMQDCRTAGWV